MVSEAQRHSYTVVVPTTAAAAVVVVAVNILPHAIQLISVNFELEHAQP